MTDITAELVIKAYTYGVFPMAKSRQDTDVFWVQPKLRGVIPSTSSTSPIRSASACAGALSPSPSMPAFAGVMAGCAESAEGRADTWINDRIIGLFTELYDAGLAHSIETWEGDALVGGLYGLAMGAAFFGESMFSRATDASKVALCHLAGILKTGGFVLLDTQFITDHLKQFGAVEISQKEYLGPAVQRAGAAGRLRRPAVPARTRSGLVPAARPALNPHLTSGPMTAPSKPDIGFKEFVTMIAAVMAVNALAIDTMLPALPDIGNSVGIPTESGRQWIVTSYLLGFGGAQLVFGTISDRFGRRRVLLAGLAGYFALQHRSAPSPPPSRSLMAARGLQGIGAAATRVLAISIVRDRFVGRQMARVMSLVFIVLLAVPIIAPSFGQFIMLFAPWRWVFGVLAIYSATVLVWVAVRLKETIHAEDRLAIISWPTSCSPCA